MHVYNTVLVLKEILEVFPVATVNEVVGSRIDFEITKLINSEERGDLKILARAYVLFSMVHHHTLKPIFQLLRWSQKA